MSDNLVFVDVPARNVVGVVAFLAVIFFSSSYVFADNRSNASFTHGARYESDGKGGAIYVAYIINDGQAVLSCDVVVRGLVWEATGGLGGMQRNYSDRRRVVVYPGREGTAGFSRVVPNSGSYQVSCNRA